MLRARGMFSWLPLGLILILGSPALAQDNDATEVAEESAWKVYDLRDLAAVLPPPEVNEQPAAEGTDEKPERREPPPDRMESVERLMETLCDDVLGIMIPIELSDGIFALEAEPATHEQLTDLLDTVRELYSERFAVTLRLYRTPADSAPRLGDEPPDAPPWFEVQLTAQRRSPTPIVHLEQRAYLANLMPTVAEGAVGYMPQIEVAEAGVELMVLVGAGPQDDNGTTVLVDGQIRDAAVNGQSPPFGSEGNRVDLPSTEVVSVHSSLPVAFDRPTVIYVSADPDEGLALVIAVAVGRI